MSKETNHSSGMSDTHILVIVGLVCVMLLGTAIVYVYLSSFTYVFSPESWSKVHKGMHRQKVVKLLGKPVKICRRKAREVKVECSVKSYGKPPPVRAERAYVYKTVEQALYVYFDEEERVVKVVLTGS